MKHEVALLRKLTMAFLVLLSLAAACAPAAAPTPTPAPTAVPITAAPRSSPTAVAPATAPAAPTAASRVSPTAAALSTPTPEKPQYGGVLTLGLAADPPSLDPNAESTGNTNEPARAVLDNLLMRDPYQAMPVLKGRLVERWEVSPDGKTITLYLRRDVKFHDGTTMTSADVKFYLDRYRKPPEGVRSTAIATLEPISSVDAPDDYTVKLSLKAPTAPMVDRLTGIRLQPKKWLEAGNDPKTGMMGTGPFKFKGYAPGISVEFVRSANFWQPGKPYLDGVTWYVLKDPSTRLAALRTGQIKGLWSYFSAVPAADRETLEKARSPVKLWPMATQLGPLLNINVRAEPWKDVRVRKAVNLVVDRWLAVDVVFLGAGRVGTRLTYMDPPGIPYEELVTLPGFRKDKTADLAEARRLMAEAGYPNGFEATLLTRALKSFQDQTVFIVDQMSKLGIKSTLEIKEDSAWFSQLRTGNFSANVFNTTMSPGSDPEGVRSYHYPGGSLSFHGYAPPDYVAQLDALVSEVDPVKRKKLVYDIDKRIHFDDALDIFLGWLYNYNAAWPDVRGYAETAPDSAVGVLENVWLAK